jgi:hypothetical protein
MYESFTRELVWDAGGEWGCVGWRFAGNDVFRAADPRINAHDLLEHFPDDDGRAISGELEAIGAIWYGRVQSGVVYQPPVSASSLADCVVRNSNELRQVVQEEIVVRGALRRTLPDPPEEAPLEDVSMDRCLREVVALGFTAMLERLHTESYLSAMETYLDLAGEAASRAIFAENHERLERGEIERAALAWMRRGFRRAHERYGSPKRLGRLYLKAYEGIRLNCPAEHGERLRIDVDVADARIHVHRQRRGGPMRLVASL